MTVPMNETNSWFPEMQQRIRDCEAERDALQQRIWLAEKEAGEALADRDAAQMALAQVQQRVRELEAHLTDIQTTAMLGHNTGGSALKACKAIAESLALHPAEAPESEPMSETIPAAALPAQWREEADISQERANDARRGDYPDYEGVARYESYAALGRKYADQLDASLHAQAEPPGWGLRHAGPCDVCGGPLESLVHEEQAEFAHPHKAGESKRWRGAYRGEPAPAPTGDRALDKAIEKFMDGPVRGWSGQKGPCYCGDRLTCGYCDIEAGLRELLKALPALPVATETPADDGGQ